MRSINYTYMNNGAPFVFRVDKMTKHPYKGRGATMLQTHALLTLAAKDDGDNVQLLDQTGKELEHGELVRCAKTGRVAA